VAVGAQNNINISLEADVTSLSEIVCSGLWPTRKERCYRAMSTVTAENFNKGVIVSPDQLFQGKVAWRSDYFFQW